MKTFSKVMSLIVMRWCGSMSQDSMCTVRSTACSTYAILGHAGTPPHNN